MSNGGIVHLESWQNAREVEYSAISEEELTALDEQARSNLEAIFHLIPHRIATAPHINFIYMYQSYTGIPSVPVDLQLGTFLKKFPQMAREECIARKDHEDYDVTRAIWHYGLDPRHSFSRYYESVRYNLALMYVIMAEGFPDKYCQHQDVKEFVYSYVFAWMSSTCFTGQLGTQDFSAQEHFIKFWTECRLDLVIFKANNETKRASELCKKLRAQALPRRLKERTDGMAPGHILLKRAEGALTEEDFTRYGASLIFDAIQEIDDAAARVNEKYIDYKEVTEREVAWLLPNECKRESGDYRRVVAWESELVHNLLNAVDPNLPHPDKIKDKGRKFRPEPQGSPWVTTKDWFGRMEEGIAKILRETEAIDELTAGVGAL